MNLPQLKFPIRESPTAPHGYIVVSFTIEPTGRVADARAVESKAIPEDHWFHTAAVDYIESLRYPSRETQCVTQMRIKFEPDAAPGA